MTQNSYSARSASPTPVRSLRSRLFLKLAAQGYSIPSDALPEDLSDFAAEIFARYAEQRRLLHTHRAPIDVRLTAFLDRMAALVAEARFELPTNTLVLDHAGLARELSFPDGESEYANTEVSSYRLDNGVLHNPTSDRRTTLGVFHVADVGFPVPADKLAVPLVPALRLLRAAFAPPKDLTEVPFTARFEHPVHSLVSLYLRPLVCPAVPGVTPERRSEIRFFVPGGLVSNLDFVESIFGNWGDPDLPENDAALDPEHFTGHSGAVVLAPHLRTLRKVDLGLPHIDQATPRQKREGMCWAEPHELYNGGRAFKLALRDESGVMITILADNYFGYCKKEVKTQIGFSANLLGLAEEEHSGGALAFPSYSLGHRFLPDPRVVGTDHRFASALELLADEFVLEKEGYATHRKHPTIHVLPEDVEVDPLRQEATYSVGGERHHLRVLLGHHYFHPSGFRLRLERQGGTGHHHLVGTHPSGTVCHKPCTVSGGGKSEISKTIGDAITFGPIYVGDFATDLEKVKEVLERDYGGAVLPTRAALETRDPGRPILSNERSLGSVIKLLTPNADLYTEAHNAFISAIAPHIKAIVFAIKRHYLPEWGHDYARHLSVDSVNGAPGHELKLDGVTLSGAYLRVGHEQDGSRRMYKLRQDFVPADKVQMEDDITASVVVPRSSALHLAEDYDGFPSVKIAENCENRLFQRPDDAIVPGYDSQTEADMAATGLFASNFEPLSSAQIRDLTEQADLFELFSPPMREHLARGAESLRKNVCSAKPRLVDGKPSKNPRYLQLRPDLARPIDRVVAETAARLYRRIPAGEPVVFPVSSVLSGRRNNPPDEIDGKKIRPLCVYGPIHYQELPELFMDYVCSVTGKSPSTTGAGSEGALTKGPFNALPATADLNNALVGMLLTGYGGFSTAAGYIGPRYKVDHDVSLLVPEIWCRLSPDERDPRRMIERGELEVVSDFEFEGRKIPASRLGYRITERFVHHYLGRIFDGPTLVFPRDFLRPELQDRAVFVDGVENLVEAQARAAEAYFSDGTIALACPPLRALLHIMAHGHFEGKDVRAPEIRALFTREALLESEWYRARLGRKQQVDVDYWRKRVADLEAFAARPGYEDVATRLSVERRLRDAAARLAEVESPNYVESLRGTLGRDLLR